VGQIVISTNVSLDGVVQDPDGKEGSPFGGWFARYGGPDLDEWSRISLEESMRADALLLGRRSDEWFASRWLGRAGAWADRLNSLPKYVVSATLTEPKWSNTTIISGNVVAAATQLKHERAGDIVVYGSYQLARTLIEHDLADELRLVVYPVVLGAGERLFGPGADQKAMRLAGAATIGGGLAFLTYRFDRSA